MYFIPLPAHLMAIEITNYVHNPQVFNQEYQKLLDYSQEINEILHAKKVKESQRSLLISGILIALQNSAFLNSYMKHKNPLQLANNLVEVINRKFKFILKDEELSLYKA